MRGARAIAAPTSTLAAVSSSATTPNAGVCAFVADTRAPARRRRTSTPANRSRTDAVSTSGRPEPNACHHAENQPGRKNGGAPTRTASASHSAATGSMAFNSRTLAPGIRLPLRRQTRHHSGMPPRGWSCVCLAPFGLDPTGQKFVRRTPTTRLGKQLGKRPTRRATPRPEPRRTLSSPRRASSCRRPRGPLATGTVAPHTGDERKP